MGYNQVNADLSEIVSSELLQKPYTRRLEGLNWWTTNGDSPQNIDLKDDRGSFIRFVCAGYDAFQTQTVGILLVKSFSSGLRATIEPGSESLAGQFARFRTLSEPVAILSPPSSPTESPRSGCLKDTDLMLNELAEGFALTDTTDEIAIGGALAVVESGQAILSAVGNIAKELLQVVNDIKARQRAAQFMAANRENLNIVITQILRPISLTIVGFVEYRIF